MEDKEQEVHGKWLTEDAMKKSGKYSSTSVKAMVAYCRRFPESLVRPGMYKTVNSLLRKTKPFDENLLQKTPGTPI